MNRSYHQSPWGIFSSQHSLGRVIVGVGANRTEVMPWIHRALWAQSDLQEADVIISNCVINLSGDKDRVFSEAYRVLKPGGRFAVSDVVVRGDVPAEIRENILFWVGCIAGALQADEYVNKLAKAGFEKIAIEPTRVYQIEDARRFLSEKGVDVDAIASQVNGRFMSAFVRAIKPARCCAPGCCE